jgi:MFS family permease
MKNRHPDPKAAAGLLSLIILSAFHGINHTFSIFLSPLNEDIRAFFGTETIASITSFKTTYLVVYAASNFLFGFLTNRVSSRRILAAGGIINGLAVGSFFLITPRNYPVMYLLWAVAGLGGGVYHPVANVLVTRLFPRRKGWAIGVTGMGASAGFAFGPLLTGFLSGPAGLTWQQISPLFGALGVAMGVAVFVVLKDLPFLETAPSAPPRENGPLPLSFDFFLAYIIFASGLREITMWSVMDISDFFLTRAHAAGGRTAFYLFLMYLVGIFAQPAAGTYSDRVGRHRLAATALFLHGGAIALLALAPGPLLFLPFLLIGIGQSGSVPTIEALVADATDTRKRGMAFGFLVTIGMGMGALGPLFSGLLVDRLGGTVPAYRACLFVLGLLAVAAGLLISFSQPVRRALGVPSHAE